MSAIRAFAQPLIDTAPWHATDERDTWRSEPEVERDCLLCLDEGRVDLLRSYTEVLPEIVAFDATLLTRLGQGALGPLVWDVLDEEYAAPMAGGDDADSLLLHLSPAVPEAELRAHYEAYYRPLELDLRGVDPLPALTAALGAPAFDEPAAFAEWLKTARLTHRRLTVCAPPDLVPWAIKLLRHAPRLLMSFPSELRR